MTLTRIKRLLERNGVPYIEKDGRILADSMENGTKFFEKTIDVTNYTFQQLLAWLGY